MQRYLINHLDAGEFILLLMVVILSLAITIAYLSKKYLSEFMSYDNNIFTGYFLGSISSSYAFVLGFIIVTLWRELYEVKSIITHEAEYLSLLVYNASAFPSAIQNEILNGIDQYIQIIIQDEWPLMQIGEASEKAVPALVNLFHIIQSYSPTQVEATFYNQFVGNLNKVVEFRRNRLEFLDSSLIPIIRFMLGFGIVIILFLVSLLDCESKKLKILSITLVCSVLSFNLGLALLLDYPLSGSISAKSAPFTKGILKRFDPNNKEKPMIGTSPIHDDQGKLGAQKTLF